MSVTVLFIGALLALFVAGWVGMRVTRSTGNRALQAWLLGVALLIFASWFGGRADERPIEGVIAALGTVVCICGLWRLRRSNKAHA